MFLIDKFRQFYGEVLRLRGRVSEGSWPFQGDGTVGGTAEEPQESPRGVWSKLVAVLEQQSLDAAREGGEFGVQLYRRAQYAMAAMADEVFINLQWEGSEDWRDHLLEAKFFDTHRAGDELFDRIDALIKERDSLNAELARVYLMVLALGFEGKYRDHPQGQKQIESYRRRLFRFIYAREPKTLQGGEHVVPQAYSVTLEGAAVSRLPYLKPWIWTIVLVIAVWIAGSHLIWRNAVSHVKKSVDVIVPPPAGGRR